MSHLGARDPHSGDSLAAGDGLTTRLATGGTEAHRGPECGHRPGASPTPSNIRLHAPIENA